MLKNVPLTYTHSFESHSQILMERGERAQGTERAEGGTVWWPRGRSGQGDPNTTTQSEPTPSYRGPVQLPWETPSSYRRMGGRGPGFGLKKLSDPIYKIRKLIPPWPTVAKEILLQPSVEPKFHFFARVKFAVGGRYVLIAQDTVFEIQDIFTTRRIWTREVEGEAQRCGLDVLGGEDLARLALIYRINSGHCQIVEFLRVNLRTGEAESCATIPIQMHTAHWNPIIMGELSIVPLCQAILLVNWCNSTAIILGIPKCNGRPGVGFAGGHIILNIRDTRIPKRECKFRLKLTSTFRLQSGIQYHGFTYSGHAIEGFGHKCDVHNSPLRVSLEGGLSHPLPSGHLSLPGAPESIARDISLYSCVLATLTTSGLRMSYFS
ncbi:hypothetical protein C8R43DRAFT_1144028 [Mycena crocata]|nr:hypothetical protein C8R43DRAFT_1144028 [Mycena crocata]